MAPTVGRIVHYKLTSADVDRIIAQRVGRATGAGNQPSEGDICPAVIVRKFGNDSAVNLQVLLDGPDSYWATSRTLDGSEDMRAGAWCWPPRS